LFLPELSSLTKDDMAFVTESAATNKSFLKLRFPLNKDPLADVILTGVPKLKNNSIYLSSFFSKMYNFLLVTELPAKAVLTSPTIKESDVGIRDSDEADVNVPPGVGGADFEGGGDLVERGDEFGVERGEP